MVQGLLESDRQSVRGDWIKLDNEEFVFLFCSVAQQPNSGLGRRLFVDVPRSHTIRHTHTPGRAPVQWSARRRGRYIHNTTHTHTHTHTKDRNIHDFSVIRTRDPSKRVAADLTHNTVGVVTSLRDERSGVRIPTGARDLSLPQWVEAGSATHPASYSVGKGFFWG
jgi:hypothetical protein